MLEPVLELAKDSVSAVRRRLCALLPALKRALRPPAEVEHLATLIQVLSFVFFLNSLYCLSSVESIFQIKPPSPLLPSR